MSGLRSRHACRNDEGTYQMVGEDGTRFRRQIPVRTGDFRRSCIEPEEQLYADRAFLRCPRSLAPLQAARKRSLSVLPERQAGSCWRSRHRSRPAAPAAHHHYIGLDLTHATAAPSRVPTMSISRPVRGDAQNLPFAAGQFRYRVLHLILAVVPDPAKCLGRNRAVLRPGGQALVFDKFLRPGEPAWLRRGEPARQPPSPRALDVVFESLLPAAPGPKVEPTSRRWLAAGSRMIRLRRV